MSWLESEKDVDFEGLVIRISTPTFLGRLFGVKYPRWTLRLGDGSWIIANDPAITEVTLTDARIKASSPECLLTFQVIRWWSRHKRPELRIIRSEGGPREHWQTVFPDGEITEPQVRYGECIPPTVEEIDHLTA